MTDTASPAASSAVLAPDLCVIGRTAGGIAVASTAALFGVSVVLVDEPGRQADAPALREALRAASIRMPGDHAAARAHVDAVAATLALNGSRERLAALGVNVLTGEASFRNRRTLAVGESIVRARRFVVATGAKPAMPAIPGLAELRALTEETLLAQAKRPEQLIVLGGTAAALELAQAMRRLGSEVAVVAPDGLLPEEDAEAVDLLRRVLLAEGIALHEGSPVLRAESQRQRPRLVLAGETIVPGSHLLIAAGRRADIDGLELDLAGVVSSADGIAVDRALRSSNRRIYAIGGCAGGEAAGLDGEHAAQHQAGLVVRNALFRLPVRLRPRQIPRVVACRPELASVGLSEAQARAGGPIQVLRWPYAENERAQAEGAQDGLIKLIADKRGRVLGATIAGAQASELISLWCLAVQKGLSVKEMAELVLPSPSLSELSRRVALSAHAPLAGKPGIRRLIGLLRRFG